MANHVYNYIYLDKGNEAVEKEWNKLFTNYHEEVERPNFTGDGTLKMREYHEIQKHPFLEGYDEDDWYNWGCENIGAKWIETEDWHEYGMSGHSAWSPPNPMVESLVQYIFDKVGGDVRATMTYEDEFRNYIGKSEFWIEDNQCEYDIEEIDGDELISTLEAWSGWDTSSDEFSWWDLTKVEALDGEFEPQEVMDEMVYGFFDDGKVEVRHD